MIKLQSKLELDLAVYSATSLAKDEDLSSSNLTGVSYSSMIPAHRIKQDTLLNDLSAHMFY